MKIGLVLEGGGMRGLYTIGVLDYFMEENIYVDYVIGVSAGACNGISYISGQKGRNLRINTEYIRDKRYISISNFIKTKSFFGMDFLFDEIPNRLEIFDYDAFLKSPCEFVVGVTDVNTGKTAYFGKEDLKGNATVLKASSSIPVFSPVVPYKDGYYLDGGTSSPIPVSKALEDGCDRVIVVLTRHRSYIKQPEKFRPVYRQMFKKFPKMIELLDNRHNIYNATLSELKKLEKLGKAFVIAPAMPINISRFENDPSRLKKLYYLGFNDASNFKKNIIEFSNGRFL